jgi:hypothetical protein
MRKREPVEIVLIAVPVLCEAIAVCLFIAAAAIGIIIANTPAPI